MTMFSKLFFGRVRKNIQTKAISRRLELLGLEDRITPATISVNGSNEVVIQLAGAENITNLNTSINGALITINTLGSNANTPSGTTIPGLNISNQAVVVDTAVLTNFSGISVLGVDSNLNQVTIGATGIDLSSAPGGANQSLKIDLSQVTIDQDTLTVQGPIKTKGSGNASLTSVYVDILANGAITTSSTGNAAITALQENKTAANVTTANGNITFTGDTMLTGNVEINTTSGNVLFNGRVYGDNQTTGNFGLKANAGSGTFAVVNDIGYTPLSSSNTFPLSQLKVTTTNASAQAISLNGSLNHVDSGEVNLNAVGGIGVTGKIFATFVNASSTAGDISFGDQVQTSHIGGFTSTTAADKATKIAAAVNVLNGASATVNGNLVVNHASNAIIDVTSTGSISITGNVTAAIAGNKLELSVANGAITIGGAIGSDAAPLGDFSAGGNSGSTLSAFTVTGPVFAKNIALNSFGKSVSFAEAVKLTSGGSTGLSVVAIGAGTITFGKNIDVLDANDQVQLSSDDGAITVNGSITGKNEITITANGNGNITLAGAVSTDQTNGNVNVQSGTGNILVKGAVNTLGSAARIEIDTITSGNITIDGNISTTGGGNIFLGAEISGVATGTGNITINGTVTTTGTTTSGSIYLATGGAGTFTINKNLSTGSATSSGSIFIDVVGAQVNTLNVSKGVNITSAGQIQFETQGSTNTISLAAGVNISSVGSVIDSTLGTGTGILNLAGNITTTNGDIVINDNILNLGDATSLKAGGTGKLITITSVQGNQNLTLNASGAITIGTLGSVTPLNTLTIENSQGATFSGNFNAANVVISDTSNGAGIQFQGDSTIISKKFTTTTKGYNVLLGDSLTDVVVIAGTPEFLNLGAVSMQGNISLPAGGAITAGSTSTVTLGGTIVSGSYFNISSVVSTTFANNTQLILNSSAFPSTIVSPIILNNTGNGSLKLLGVGTLNLSGNSSIGATTGDSIDVINGKLNVTGKLGSGAQVNLTNGTISGAGGTIGALNSLVGNVSPGGTLSTGTINLDAATNYNVAITGSNTAGNLQTAAAIQLGGALLNLTSVASGLRIGNQLTIINNTAASSTPINGTFAGLAEGATVSAKDASGNTVNFTISYKGADGFTGNDAVLTVTSVIPSQSAPSQPMVAGQPALNKFTAVGADAGGGPLVTITFPNGTYTSFFAYASSFTGGVRVALGDVNGDGSIDVITGAGPGGGPQVNVYNVNPLSGVVTLQSSFFAFSAPSFTGGVYVATGQTNSDFYDDVIVGAGAGGGSRVQVYAGSESGVVATSTLNDFFAYSPAFTGGVVVAAGNRDGDLNFIDEVITAPASNGGWNIKSFNCDGTGNNPTLVDNFFAFNNTTAVGGLSLAVGDFNLTNIADLVIGTSNGGYGVILDNATSGIAGVPFAGFAGAIRAGIAEDSNGVDYAVALAGPTGGPRISVFGVGPTSLVETDNLFVMSPSFTGGLFGTPTLAETVV
jgi:hypothetical protein